MELIQRTRWIWVLLLSVILSITLQVHIGNANVYFKREAPDNAFWIAQHEGILTNSGTRMNEALLGKNGVNIRIGVVYLADWISKTTGQPVMKTYRWLDNLFLAGSFFLLYCFIGASMGSNLALIGLLYYAFSQITSYFPGGWHPWDRPSQLLWILGLFLVRRNQVLPLLAVVWVGMLVKYDLIMISGVYFLTYLSRGNWKRAFTVSVALFGSCVGILMYLLHLFPRDSSEPGSSVLTSKPVFEINIEQFLKSPLTYPPSLVFVLPILFGLFGWKRASQFEKAGFTIGGLALVAYFLTTYFNETRAEMPLLLMMLPCALRGMEAFLCHTFPFKQQMQENSR